MISLGLVALVGTVGGAVNIAALGYREEPMQGPEFLLLMASCAALIGGFWLGVVLAIVAAT